MVTIVGVPLESGISTFDDTALFEYDDTITVSDGGQAVCIELVVPNQPITGIHSRCGILWQRFR